MTTVSKCEVRCANCGALNRVVRFHITRQARCGSCKRPLSEPTYVRWPRAIYRQRQWIPIIVIGSFLGGLIVWSQWDSWMLGLACTEHKRPAHGLFARYHDGLATVPVTITSAAGADYFVKFVTPAGNPVAAFFVHGGQDLIALMPVGTFIEKDAAGDHWCGEVNLFGASTAIEEGTRLVTLADDGEYRLRLTKQKDGNFPTKRISRKDF